LKKKSKTYFVISVVLFSLFVLLSLLLTCFDVKAIGPENSELGFAGINAFLFRQIGVHPIWYSITDWLGIIPILFALGFTLLGLVQLLKRKSIRKVDKSILALGLLYFLVIVFYLFFEHAVVNYRPVILEAGLEASYPSSHTLIVVCIMISSALEFHTLCPSRKKLCLGIDILSCLLVAVTVIGRLLSGVHWFTDIIGGLLLSAALLMLYYAIIEKQT